MGFHGCMRLQQDAVTPTETATQPTRMAEAGTAPSTASDSRSRGSETGTSVPTTAGPLELSAQWESSGAIDKGEAVIDDGILYFVDGPLTAADPKRGSPTWRAERLDSDLVHSEIHLGESLIFTEVAHRDSRRRDIYAFSRSSGDLAWRFARPDSDRWIAKVRSVSDYVVCFRRAHDSDAEHVVIVLHADDGSVAHSIIDTEIRGVAAVGSKLYISYHGRPTSVLAIDDGTELGQLEGHYQLYRNGWLYGFRSKYNLDTGESISWDLPGGSRGGPRDRKRLRLRLHRCGLVGDRQYDG